MGGCAGRSYSGARSEERQREETPTHSLSNQANEDEREGSNPGPGWSGGTGRIRLLAREAEGEGGCQGLVRETAAGTKMGSPLWRSLWLRVEVLASPIDRLHTEPPRRLPEQRQRHRSG